MIKVHQKMRLVVKNYTNRKISGMRSLTREVDYPFLQSISTEMGHKFMAGNKPYSKRYKSVFLGTGSNK